MTKIYALVIVLAAIQPAINGQTPLVQSVTLMNANTNQPVGGFDPIVSGATINLATLPTRNLNIRANASPTIVGSVRFTSALGVRTETAAPYAMAGDTSGDYGSWTPAVGAFKLTAVAYTGANGTGTAGPSLSIVLNVIDQQPASSYSVTVNGGSGSGRYPFNSVVSIEAAPAPMGKVFNSWTGDVSVLANASAPETAFPMPTRDLVFTATYKDAVATVTPVVTGLTLINTETSQPISGFDPILNGTILHLGTIATRKLNIRANTSPATVGSVKFVYTGGSRVESTAPYTLAGDNGPTAYTSWTPAIGTLNITAIAYSGPNATGTAGPPVNITITVQDSTTTTPPPPPPPPTTPTTGMPEERNGYVRVEAEAFVSQTNTQNRRWYLTTTSQTPNVTPDGDPNHASTASGGAYLEILPDTRRSSGDPLVGGVNFADTAGAVGVLNYPIKFNTPGRYYVWARILFTTTEDNGMHVGLNGAWPESGKRMQWCSGKFAWYWDSKQRTAANHCGEFGKIYLDIPSAGVHTVSFSMREDGVEFDAFILTTNPSFPRPN